MNRTDRLLAIILELQRYRQRRAEDLATTFEVTKRTIYRDIQALSEAGVPIVAITGQGYSLAEGYFLPPVHFTADEAFMLVLGSDFTAQHFDAQYRLASQSARRKIEGILPERLQSEVHYLQESISFIRAGTEDDPTEIAHLRLLRRAIIEHKQVHLSYRKRYAEEGYAHISQRDIDPYGLTRHGEAWYLVGYCHLRRSVRSFRLSRIDRMILLDKAFTRPATFSPAWRKSGDTDRNLTIQILLDAYAAHWIRESPTFYIIEHQTWPDGLLVTLQVRHESEALHWLMSWGSHICVLEPESLRRAIAEEAQKMYQNHIEPY